MGSHVTLNLDEYHSISVKLNIRRNDKKEIELCTATIPAYLANALFHFEDGDMVEGFLRRKSPEVKEE